MVVSMYLALLRRFKVQNRLGPRCIRNVWAPMTGLFWRPRTSAMVTLTPPGRHDREVFFSEEPDRGQPVPEV